MTPAEQAEAIVDKYREPTQYWDEIEREWVDNIEIAKQCAILHCNGIIDELPDELIGQEPETGLLVSVMNFRKHHWEQVLKEIQKL
jgi:hypothetical protein